MTTNGSMIPVPAENGLAMSNSITSAKRKRSESEDGPRLNGVKPSRTEVEDLESQDLSLGHDSKSHLVGRNVVEILARHDTNPSILDLSLNDVTPSAESLTAESKAKRVKLSQATSSIRSKMLNGIYHTLEDVLSDVEKAVAHVIAPLNAKEALQPTSGYAMVNPLSMEETRLMTGALALQKLAKSLVSAETQLKHTQLKQTQENVPQTTAHTVREGSTATNSVIEIDLDDKSEALNEAHSVLTVWANAQGHRQLFSSLQRPKSTQASDTATKLEHEVDADVKLPIRPDLLPNMLSTTNVLESNLIDARPRVSRHTLGDRFAAPSSIAQLTPPRHNKHNTASIMTWEFLEGKAKSRRPSNNYTSDVTSYGHWLSYRGFDKAQESISLESKRKQRDRALSTGETQPRMSLEAQQAVEQAKEEALFRSVYSSFAPSRDDSAAIIPAQTRDLMWWNNVGEKKFNEVFQSKAPAIDPQLLAIDDGEANTTDGFDEGTLKEDIKNFEEEEPFVIQRKRQEKDLDDTDGILDEISELLETLNSYQRIRNVSLTSHSHNRTPSVTNQQATMANLSGSPTQPTSSETSIYNMLKLQLVIMIKQLPPFAVSKLNGEQLAELNITRNLLVEGEDLKGSMEEDQLSRAAKLNVPASHLSARIGPSSTQYATSTPQYHRQGSGTNRASSATLQRSAAGQFQSPGAFSASTSRPSYNNTHSYNQNTARPPSGPSNYNQTQQYYQATQNARSSASSQYYSGSPQPVSQSRGYGQSSAASSYQRGSVSNVPNQAPPMYGYSNNAQTASHSPHARVASPLKATHLQPSHMGSRQQYQNATAPTYGTPMSASVNPQGRSSYNTNLSGANYNSSSPSTPIGPSSGYYGSMSSQDQQRLLDRQRFQANQQAGLQRPGGANT